jgi:hypothetical protein
LARRVLPDAQTERVVELVFAVDKLQDIGVLAAALAK